MTNKNQMTLTDLYYTIHIILKAMNKSVMFGNIFEKNRWNNFKRYTSMYVLDFSEKLTIMILL